MSGQPQTSWQTRVLVALDGSEDWNGVVDYIGKIAGAASAADVLLYHVLELRPESATYENRRDPEKSGVPIDERVAGDPAWIAERKSDIESKVLTPAREGLQAGDTSGNMNVRTEVEAVTDTGVAEIIMRKVRGEGYDTVVVGRRQQSKPHGPGLGHVAGRVVHDMPDCAVWVLQ